MEHSLILTNKKLVKNIHDFGFFEGPLNKFIKVKKFKLLYRGSRNGFKALDFHRCCDNQGCTFTIIKSEMGKIFGGYTDIPW